MRRNRSSSNVGRAVFTWRCKTVTDSFSPPPMTSGYICVIAAFHVKNESGTQNKRDVSGFAINNRGAKVPLKSETLDSPANAGEPSSRVKVTTLGRGDLASINNSCICKRRHCYYTERSFSIHMRFWMTAELTPHV